MRKDILCEKIIEENYAAIFRFCKAKLGGDLYGAEECTQEVFLLLLQKKKELDLNDQIVRWLLAAASRITKKYCRKQAERYALESDGIEEVSDEVVDSARRAPEFESLTDEEYNLLLRYYSMDSEMRGELATELGISVNTLYQRIYAIKCKVKT